MTADQSVFIRYAAYPYQKFGMHQGRISAISRTPIHPADIQASALGAASALM
jgi:membrane fusion protein